MDVDAERDPIVAPDAASAARAPVPVFVLVEAGQGCVLQEARPWAYRPRTAPQTVVDARAATEASAVLARWADWPDAAAGFRLGIVADVRGAALELTSSGRVTASVARTLTWAVGDPDPSQDPDSEPIDPAGPALPSAVVLADPSLRLAHPGPPADADDPEDAADPEDVADPGGAGGSAGTGDPDDAVALAACLPRVARLTGLTGRRGARLLVLITESCDDLDDATTRALHRLRGAGCAVLAIHLDRVSVGVAGEPVTGAAALTLDPAAPIPARAVALAALDALHRADPARAL